MARGGGSRGGGGFSRGGGGSFGGSRGSFGRSGGSGSINRGGTSSRSGGFARGGSGNFGGMHRPEGGGRVPRPPIIVYGGGGRGHRPLTPNPVSGGPSGGGGCGCLTPTWISILAVLLVILVVVSLMGGGSGSTSSGNITASTIAREPLAAGLVDETGYFTDELGWIASKSTLTSGMKRFYQETGVQPYLYLTGSVNGSTSPTAQALEAYANDLYDTLFTDEAHALLVFFEVDGEYRDHLIVGTAAKTVIDSEAADILLDYIDSYYYDKSLTDEEYFSLAFEKAAERIMTVYRSPWPATLAVLAVLALAILLFVWWKKRKAQKNLEAKQTEEILNTPLEKFGSTEAEELAKKYDEDSPAT